MIRGDKRRICLWKMRVELVQEVNVGGWVEEWFLVEIFRY